MNLGGPVLYNVATGGLRIPGSDHQLSTDHQGPRKRQRVGEASESVTEAHWDQFEQELRMFDVQHVQGKGKFAFAFVEGPLVKALRSGDWYVHIIFFQPDLSNSSK